MKFTTVAANQQSIVMVSMDSGNAHIAAMLGVKSSHWAPSHAGFSASISFRERASFDRKVPNATHSVYGNKIVLVMKRR
jgi:hypothetical protein